MLQQFRIFKRRGIFYREDRSTGEQKSLKTKIKAEALVLLYGSNEAHRQPNLNLHLARVYLLASDPETAKRVCQDVMNRLASHGKEQTRLRCAVAMRSKDFDAIRNLRLCETKADDFFHLLETCAVSSAHYLRRLHNLAFKLGWLNFAVINPNQWPKLKFKTKRGITALEHEAIIASERNAEKKLYYQMLWEIGSSQSDGALLSHANVNEAQMILNYVRMKSGTPAKIAIGPKLKALIEKLPQTGPFFPKISRISDNARASEFSRRCRLVGVKGVTLHSYRYAWAERARALGYPERFAMEALGHDSEAVHRAYSKGGDAKIPSLEDFERAMHEKLGNVINLEAKQAA